MHADAFPEAQVPDSLAEDIKIFIIQTLALEDISPADIDPDAPLFNEGLGLDSIDALELGLALQKRYGITLSAESHETRKHFSSINALAALIASRRPD
ncbi:phosphopantetheine-binding protein [Xanthomonadaceae bacterium XH05]|nr:phosphopantetheine-binding protein [Xanthomonadaceae bacterium XH05]